MNRLLVIAALIIVIVTALISSALIYFERFLDLPLDVPEGGMTFEIAPGTPFVNVGQELEDVGVLTDADLFRWYASWTGQAASVQAGEYHIASGTTPAQLLEQFTRGDVLLYSITIIEGWNYRELLAAIHAAPAIEATLSDEDWPALLAELGAEASHPEGLFLPETYRFPRGTSDRDVLRQAFTLMKTALGEEWQSRDMASPVTTPYEALVLASIVEKETGRADERGRIAGVFARRLQKRMRLQTDPTVIYGIGPVFDGNLTRKHLQTDTPYNTYTRHGLPPTPIAMPGRAAIHAALHPEPGEELYFVATGTGDGSHKFSVTRNEHDAAVREYLQRLRRQKTQEQ
ncbi:MAG: endolytic transglycosylase MltG [Woeseiaceae bacterium]